MTSSEVLLQDLIDLEAKEVIAGLVEPAVSTVRIDTTQLEPLTDNGIVRVLKTAAAEIARLEAIQVRGTAVLARRRRDRTDTAAEVALALCLTDGYAGAFVAAADALTTRLPNTFALLERGQLNLFRAMKVTDATAWLSDDAAREADAALAPRLQPKTGKTARTPPKSAKPPPTPPSKPTPKARNTAPTKPARAASSR